MLTTSRSKFYEKIFGAQILGKRAKIQPEMWVFLIFSNFVH